MKYKYQIVFIGNLDKVSENILELFYKQVKELKLLKESFDIITEENFSKNYKGNQPSFCVYFSNKNGSIKNIDIIESLIKDATMILPVFHGSFSKEIPEILKNQNGLKYDTSKDEKIVNLILESFGKLRNSRKIFVSYKRDEATSVAIQLFEALEKNNFDVFLDTHSIKQGEPFQEELWHRMTDCDVIVLLNTPKFLESKWCEKEIAEASSKQIGVIQLVWPGHKLQSMAEICYPIQLTKTNFVDDIYNNKNISKLKEDFVDDLVRNVESLRARNLASRQDSLITEFTNIAQKNGKTVNLQPERFITESITPNKRRIFIPTIGIPQSIDYNQSEELKKEIKQFDVEKIYIIYDDLRIRNKWLNHLDWLNNYLEVKTIKKQKFDEWLQRN